MNWLNKGGSINYVENTKSRRSKQHEWQNQFDVQFINSLGASSSQTTSVPVRKKPIAHVTLSHALQLNPSMRPLHVPLRYSLDVHVEKLHVRHCSTFVVPLQVPNWNCPALHTVLLHVLHLYPLIMPTHMPLRYWPEPHTMLLQALHWNPIVVSVQTPDRNWSVAHAPLRNWLMPQLRLLHESYGNNVADMQPEAYSAPGVQGLVNEYVRTMLLPDGTAHWRLCTRECRDGERPPTQIIVGCSYRACMASNTTYDTEDALETQRDSVLSIHEASSLDREQPSQIKLYS